MKNSSTYMMLLVLIPSTTAIALADSVDEPTSSASDVDSDVVKELSVAPLDHVEYPDERPDWLDQPLQIDKDASRIVVVSGPCDSPDESLEELKLMQRAAVSTYISEVADCGGQHDFYTISDAEIDDELVLRRYEGTVMQGDSIKYEHAVELGFTNQKRREIVGAWRNLEVRDRLGAVGVLTLGGLFVLFANSMVLGMITRRVDRRERQSVES